ncbi:MAG: zinc-ribbon domain-containing protein [Actinobacteria bacterium]|nr:zinc-ribbon domain-containing protein [Actinomycetota bacterium]
MTTCPSCGQELPGEFPFCPFCGAPLTEQPAPSLHEERKVVTVLFCDLVGFTAASEAADPEDVRSRIRPYHARLRREIERYGGTVEKFIGDAVMAVFGAPVVHEDDAERAVRAGLRILEAIAELNDHETVRVAVVGASPPPRGPEVGVSAVRCGGARGQIRSRGSGGASRHRGRRLCLR